MMRRDKNTLITSAVVVMLSLSALVSLAWMLQKELSRRSSSSESRQSVAKLKNGVRQVQRKFDREILWESVATDETLFKRDAVRTAEGSEANIRFDDGTELELSENSLVILDRSQDKIGIEFLKGSVFARGGGGAGQSLEIQTAEGKVQVGKDGEKGALALSAAKSGLEVTVAEGSAQLESKQGVTALARNERGQISDAGVTKQKLNLWTKLPIHNAKYVLQGPEQPIEFSWEGIGEAKVQISSDSEFARILFAKSGNQKETLLLPPGNYYWRVVTLADGKVSDRSDVRKLRVIRHRPVRLEAPVSNATVSYFKARPSVKLRWTSTDQEGAFEYAEVSTDPGFRSPLRAEKSQKTSASSRDLKNDAWFEKLESGSYLWRVLSRYDGTGPEGKDTVEVPSLVRKFKLEQLSRLPTPELVSPALNASVGAEGRLAKVRFEWLPVSEARVYRIKVSTDSGLKSPILDQSVQTPYWEGDLNASGSLYWSVQAGNEENSSTEDSEYASPRVFALTRTGGFRLLAPQSGQVFQYLESNPEIGFVWERQGGAARYEIQIASDRGFQSILFSDDLKQTEFRSKKIPVGNRFWRIRALDDRGSVISLSEIGNYYLKEAPLLAAPEKLAPNSRARVNSDPPPKISFQWKPIEQAKSYKLTVWKQVSANQNEVFWTEETKDLSFEKKMEDGVYLWDVQAIDIASRVGTAGLSRGFEIREADRLVAPVVQTPAYGAHIEGRRPASVPLKWNPIPGAVEYQIRISKINPDGSRKKVVEEKTKQPEFVVPPTLKSGQYVLEVSGLTDRSKLGQTTASQFSVRWTGVLEAPGKVKLTTEEKE